MKNLNLNNYGIQELNAKEVLESNGGSSTPPVGPFLTDAQIKAAADAIVAAAQFVKGFVDGFFGF